MNSNQNYKAKPTAVKAKIYVWLCALTLATFSFASCENKGKGDTTAHNDTSSAVSKTVDTTATDSGTKQP